MNHALPLWTIRGFEFRTPKWFAHVLLIALLAVTLTVMGCSFASFISAAEADIPVVVQMITNITNVVAPGVSAPIVAAGTLAIAALQIVCGTPAAGATSCDPASLVGQYQAAPTATLLQKIQVTLLTVNGHISSMLQLASGLPPGIGAAIVVAIGLALSTITAVISMIPPSTTPVALKATMAKATKPMAAKTLKAQFNAAIAPQFPRAVI